MFHHFEVKGWTQNLRKIEEKNFIAVSCLMFGSKNESSVVKSFGESLDQKRGQERRVWERGERLSERDREKWVIERVGEKMKEKIFDLLNLC